MKRLKILIVKVAEFIRQPIDKKHWQTEVLYYVFEVF